METMSATQIQVFRRARALLSLRRQHSDTPGMPLLGDYVDADVGGGFVMSPAQHLAFFARSTSWRCTGCGKVHAFTHLVPVTAASPCTCASIEFEPRLETDLSWGNGQRRLQLMT